MRAFSLAAPAFTRPYRLVQGLARLGGKLCKRGTFFHPGCLCAAWAARVAGAGLYRLLQWYDWAWLITETERKRYETCFQRDLRQVRTALRSEGRIGPQVVATLVFFLCFSVGFSYEPRVNCTFAPRTALRYPELRGGENVSINSVSLRLHLSETLRKD